MLTPEPGQFTTADATIVGSVNGINDVFVLAGVTAVRPLVFLNGLLMTQPGDARTSGNIVTFSPAQTPPAASVVTVAAWTQSITSPAPAPALNLPQQFSTADGSITGTVPVLTLQTTAPLITQMMLWWNQNFLVQGVDYSFAGNVITVLVQPGQLPGDTYTAEVWFS